MAAAIYTHWRWPAKARVMLNVDGSATVEAGMHDIGTGTYTVMQQVAADALGLAPDKVIVRLGDTRLPASHPAIGSATMANAGASVLLAAKAARDKALALALTGPDAPFPGADAQNVVIADGSLRLENRNLNITYSELLARNQLVKSHPSPTPFRVQSRPPQVRFGLIHVVHWRAPRADAARFIALAAAVGGACAPTWIRLGEV
jgi:xanthine dehydrogenase YagR molybdenum-binding subunit